MRLTEMARHTHDYSIRAPQINKAAWSFLEKQKLEDEPRFQHYANAR